MDRGCPRTYNALWLGLSLVLVSGFLASCRKQAATTNTSLLLTATPVARSILPTFTAVMPTTPVATSTPYPTLPPTMTPLPTIVWTDFSPTEIAAMGVYQPVQRNSDFTLHRISDTPLGVTNLEWSPNSTHLWLNVATGPGGYANLAPTAPLIVESNGVGAWSPGSQGESIFSPSQHSWSPSGHELAYASDGQLWLLESTGAHRQLLKLPADLFPSAPQFSPDGQQIAFVATYLFVTRAIHSVARMILATGEVESLTEYVTNGKVRWAPGSDALATIYYDSLSVADGPNVEVSLNMMPLPLNKVVRVPLTRVGGSDACCQAPPVWTADGQKVVATVMLAKGVWLVDRNGKVELLVTPNTFLEGRAFLSSNGDYVIYPGEDGLRLRDLTTGDDQQISDHMGAEVTWAQATPTFLLWSKGGALMVGNVNGDLQTIATEASWPALSPDGQRILFWKPEAHGYSLWLYDRTQEQASLLLTAAQLDPDGSVTYPPYSYIIAPQWSPDGSKVAFVAWLAERPEAYVLEFAD